MCRIFNRLAALAIGLAVLPNVFAQNSGKIEDGLNIEEFPVVSFRYHSFNPEIIHDHEAWILKENGNTREFDITILPAGDTILSQTTLILWEDMAHNGAPQFNFTKDVLLGFLDSSDIPSGDKIAIASFNRRKNETPTLNYLTDGFTNNKSELISAVESLEPSKETYPQFPNRSDLYTAIREGLDKLSSAKGSKAIIVFTSGYSMTSSGADSESQVLLKAQQLHIPVYIFQYYLKSGVAPASEGFAVSTYGTFNSYKDAPTAQQDLIALYPMINKRYQGNDYLITFTTDAERGDDARTVALSVDGNDMNLQLVPPAHTFTTWIISNVLLVCLIAFCFILLLIIIFIVARNSRKRVARNMNALKQQNRRQAENIESLKQQAQEIEIKSQQQQIQILEERERARNEKIMQEKEEEKQRLSNLMQVKNLNPRLTCSSNGETFTFSILSPEVYIGRDEGNDIVIPNSTVSRIHAKISFNGTDFEIVDKGSTNKVIINGQFVQRATLRSGDIIGLGEAVITFYV